MEQAAARIMALQFGVMAVAVVALLGLFFTSRIPRHPVDPEAAADESAAAF